MTFCNSIWINSTTEWKTIHTIRATTFIWPTWKVLLIITKCLWTQYSISLIPTWTGACRHALFTVTYRTLQTKSLYFTSMIADIILTLESLLVIPHISLTFFLLNPTNQIPCCTAGTTTLSWTALNPTKIVGYFISRMSFFPEVNSPE